MTNFNKSKISILLSSILAVGLTACNSGGSSGGGGGGDTTTGITTLATLSGLVTSYSPTCIINDELTSTDPKVYLIKRDGSGTGVAYSLRNGTVANVSNLPVITSTQNCMPNKYQLTWYDQNDVQNVNAMQGIDINTIRTFDINAIGLSGDQIGIGGFGVSSATNTLFINKNLPDNNFGLAALDSGLTPTSYTDLDVGSLAGRDTALFGFASSSDDSGEITMSQLLQTSGDAPASLSEFRYYNGSMVSNSTTNFVDANGSAIADMAGAVDYIPDTLFGQSAIIQTGLVQPKFYQCNPTAPNTFTCANPVTSTALVHDYRVMRLLSYNTNNGKHNIVFYGMNLTNQTVGIYKYSY